MLRMLRSRSRMMSCVLVRGCVYDARARLLFGLPFRSVGWFWCPPFLSCLALSYVFRFVLTVAVLSRVVPCL